ncbi:MAG: hypothetical protein R3B47_05635 [Bacteroidia bacterium]
MADGFPAKRGDLNTSFLLRRSRVLMYAQINKRFLILTHFGMNSLSASNMGVASPSNANGGNGTFFMHDAWAEYSIAAKKLHVGAGLHYWNGLSRLTNQSTLNILTLDAPLFNWFSLGTSDQFARHLGMYAKGRLGKFDYRVSFNDALTNQDLVALIMPVLLFLLSIQKLESNTWYRKWDILRTTCSFNPANGTTNFATGKGKVLAGYFNYQFLIRKETSSILCWDLPGWQKGV